MKNKEKTVIGWREYVDLPEWGIKRLKAKIDTGAKSCSLHVENIKELDDNKISFYVVLGKNKPMKRIIATTERKGKVKSSIGTRTHRWFVQTKIRLGGIERIVKINLSDRGEMNFRMLIGRTAIIDNFVVDVAQGYVTNKKPLKIKTIKKTIINGKSTKDYN